MLYISNPPESEELYTDYSVKINGIPVKTPFCRVSAMPYNTCWPGRQRPIDQTEPAAFVSFESDESVTVEVTYKTAPGEVTVRPLSKGVKAEITGCTAKFTLPSAGQYTVEKDGFHNALHVFFNPVEDFEKYANAAKTVIRYPAGVHDVGIVYLESGTTVILDRDAYVYGSFIAICAENVTICGYGVIDGSKEVRTDDTVLLPDKRLRNYDSLPYMLEDRDYMMNYMRDNQVLGGMVKFFFCKNSSAIGVIARDSATFCFIPANCDNVIFDNVKTVGMWRYNCDGIDVFNSANIVIRNSFLRDFDDCIVLKGICGWDNRNLENILVENCVVWCDWGRNLELGAETNAPEYRNIIFRDCDLIHGSSIMLDIQHHNYADIHDVTYENIRCEYTKYQLPDTYQFDMNAPFPTPDRPGHPLLMALPIYDMGLFNPERKNGKTHNITFKDIKVITDSPDVPMPESVFQGLSKEHSVSNVEVSGVTFNGKELHTAEELRLHTNEFVYNVTVK